MWDYSTFSTVVKRRRNVFVDFFRFYGMIRVYGGGGSLTGIIDVGGGTRDIYGAGVLDALLDLNIMADVFIGVSAGSANGASYLARQRGRNYPFYADYPSRPEYLGPRSLAKTGSLLGLEYIYETLSREGGENPLDFDAMMNNPAEFIIVATDGRTGKAKYFDKSDYRRNDYTVLEASCSLPVFTKPAVVDGVPYFDGAVADPIPYKKALEMGVDKLVLILTKPVDTALSENRNQAGAKLIRRQYPNAADALLRTNRLYAESLEAVLALEREGRAVVVAPDDVYGMGTLSRDREKLTALYRKGLADAEKIAAFLR